MADDILSYLEMCQREGVNLQRGMNFRIGGDYSVILMSQRPGAPYRDSVSEDGSVLIYKGHDEPRRQGKPAPKTINQPLPTLQGSLTENGRFLDAAISYRDTGAPPERVRAYEILLDRDLVILGRILACRCVAGIKWGASGLEIQIAPVR